MEVLETCRNPRRLQMEAKRKGTFDLKKSAIKSDLPILDARSARDHGAKKPHACCELEVN